MKPYYEEEGITIFNGDCRHILPIIEPVDLILTDPPYGINVAKSVTVGGGGFTAFAGKKRFVPASKFQAGDWDKQPPPRWLFDLMQEKSRVQIIWGGNYFGLQRSQCWLVWDKENTGNFADCELAWTNMDKAVRKIKWRWNGMLQEDMANKEERLHPTMKPLEVMKWAITQAPEDCMTILDPFAGSCTTAVAAKELGRKCICIEAEERYCEIAVKRLAQEVLPL